MALLDITIELPPKAKFKMHWLADCDLLSEIFATQIDELDSPDHYPRRSVAMRGHQFTEKMTHLSDSRLMYHIEGKGPVAHHRGQIDYIRSGNGHYLHYQIHGRSSTWVPTWLLKIVMYYDFKMAARRLRKWLNER